MENPIKMDDLVVPPFEETPKSSTSQFPCHLIPCAAVATPAPATAGAVCSTFGDSGRRSER